MRLESGRYCMPPTIIAAPPEFGGAWASRQRRVIAEIIMIGVNLGSKWGEYIDRVFQGYLVPRFQEGPGELLAKKLDLPMGNDHKLLPGRLIFCAMDLKPPPFCSPSDAL